MNYHFTIQILVIDFVTEEVIDGQEIPFNAEGKTFEEARAKALEHGQSIIRGYDDKGDYAFMRVCGRKS
jgi:hypothetical protein